MFQANGLSFRLVEPSDVDRLIEIDCDEDVRAFFPGGAQAPSEIPPKIERYIETYRETGYPAFVVFDGETGEFVGRTGIGKTETGEVETGYLVKKSLWGCGYATRILMAVLVWAGENLELDEIIAFAPVEHKASRRVMQKAGMEYLRTSLMKGKLCDVYCHHY